MRCHDYAPWKSDARRQDRAPSPLRDVGRLTSVKRIRGVSLTVIDGVAGCCGEVCCSTHNEDMVPILSLFIVEGDDVC